MFFARLSLGAAALLAAALSSAQASQLYQFDSIITGDKPSGGPIFASLLVEDYDKNVVLFTLAPSEEGDPDQFLSRLFLNLDPKIKEIKLKDVSGFVDEFDFEHDDISFGGAKYDAKVTFNLSAKSNRLNAGEKAQWYFYGEGLDSSSFIVKPPEKGYLNVLHIQGIPGGGSSHVTAGDPTAAPVAEPGLLAGFGALLFAGQLGRRWGRRAP